MEEEELCGPHGVASEYKVYPEKYRFDIHNFLYKESFRKIYKHLKELLTQKPQQHFKIQLGLNVEVSRFRDSEKITIQPHFKSEMKLCLNVDDITKILHESIDDIIAFFESFNDMGSGWTLDRILELTASICKYIPFQGGNCTMHVLPYQIVKKKAVLCIQSPSQTCFKYAVLASIYRNQWNPTRYSSYKKYKKFPNFDGIEYPVRINKIAEFEKKNNLSINVYAFDKYVYPLLVSKNTVKNPQHEIDLLYYKQHFYCIRSLSRLISHYAGSQHHQAHHVCRKCLLSYKSKSDLDTHRRCCTLDGQVLQLPPEGTTKKFSNPSAQYRSDFVIYYDFECLNKKCKPENPQFRKITEHIPISVAAVRISLVDKFNGNVFLYTGMDCVEKFLQYLQVQLLEIESIYEMYSYPIDWTDSSIHKFHKSTRCALCKIKFKEAVKKCADHYHLKKHNNFR